ncbi:MAG: zinc ribbon domain-containing protein [Burkholderiaceae bacterium]|nr:zinc ribbon domain-containing protein [Burkholderiaceae bacterium]
MMFCSQCGTQINESDRFCVKCGKPTAAASSISVDAQQKLNSGDGVATHLSFGAPENRWWIPFKGKTSFPTGYEWLEKRNTLLVCRNHLVLVEGDEKRSAALDVIEAMGVVGGIVGAVRGVKDSFLNKKLELSVEHAERLFEDRLLVWCKKSDAIIWRYHEKPWMFIKSSSEQLYCPFNSKAGTLHACGVLWCTADSTGHGKGDIAGLGCRIVDAGHNLPEKKVHEAMAASRMNLPS